MKVSVETNIILVAFSLTVGILLLVNCLILSIVVWWMIPS